MVEDKRTQHVWCKKRGRALATSPLESGGGAQTPPPISSGVAKHVRIEGIDGFEFFCFTEDHPGEEHLFQVGGRMVAVPWDAFREAGRSYFLADEVRWK